MFGREYPHAEGTWPKTLDHVKALFAGVPEPEVRQILGGNAVRDGMRPVRRGRGVAGPA